MIIILMMMMVVTANLAFVDVVVLGIPIGSAATMPRSSTSS